MTALLLAPEMAAKRKSGDPTIGVPPDVHADFSLWCEDNSYIKREVTGKFLRWFMGCDEVFRKAIIRNVTKGLEREYAAAIRRIADELDPPPDIGEVNGPRPAGRARGVPPPSAAHRK